MTTSLVDLFGAPSRVVSDTEVIASAEPVALTVVSGGVDLFFAQFRDGEPFGRWVEVCRLGRGMTVPLPAVMEGAQGLFARVRPESVVALTVLELAKGSTASSDAGLPLFDRARWATVAARSIEAGLTVLSRSLRVSSPVGVVGFIDPTAMVTIEPDVSVRTSGDVRWVRVLSGSVELSSIRTTVCADDGLLCLTAGDCLRAGSGGAVIEQRSTVEMLLRGRLTELCLSVISFGEPRLRSFVTSHEAEEHDLGSQLWLSAREASEAASGATRSFASVRATSTLLLDELNTIFEAIGVNAASSIESQAETLEDWANVASRHGAVTRVIRLERNWWKKNVGPLLARGPKGEPLALLWERSGYGIGSGASRRAVDTSVATTFEPFALVAFSPIPESVTGPWDVVRWAGAKARYDVATFVFLTVMAVAIALANPVLTGRVVGLALAAPDQSALLGNVSLLILVGVVGYGISIARGNSFVRAQSRIDYLAQVGLFDRLLNIPVRFFRTRGSEAVTSLALAVSSAKELSGAALSIGSFSVLLMLGNLVVIAVLDVSAALLFLCVIAAYVSVSKFVLRRSFIRAQLVHDSERQHGSASLQFLNGVATLRLSGAQDRAFLRWTATFLTYREGVRRLRSLFSVQAVTNALVAPTAFLLLVAMYATQLWHPHNVTALITIILAGNGACAGAVQATTVLAPLVEAAPVLRQVGLVLSEPVERRSGERAHELSGRVEMRDIRFAYGRNEQPILDGFSLRVEPGEFVAIVGRTGSGKSTIIRLLLGFDQPMSGSVLFDGRGLSQLDVQDVRRQCGVVLQSSSLMPGDLFSNICGGAVRTMAQAWAAAEQAGIANDIRSLPMGMFTNVGDGGGAFSGGQIQRILLARALIGSPKLLLLDEATSALDNVSQRWVSANIQQLHATRIVVAHRLSTVQLADRIVVVDRGRIVQEGTFDTLSAVPEGLFATLVGNQLLE